MSTPNQQNVRSWNSYWNSPWGNSWAYTGTTSTTGTSYGWGGNEQIWNTIVIRSREIERSYNLRINLTREPRGRIRVTVNQMGANIRREFIIESRQLTQQTAIDYFEEQMSHMLNPTNRNSFRDRVEQETRRRAGGFSALDPSRPVREPISPETFALLNEE